MFRQIFYYFVYGFWIITLAGKNPFIWWIKQIIDKGDFERCDQK